MRYCDGRNSSFKSVLLVMARRHPGIVTWSNAQWHNAGNSTTIKVILN